MRLYHLADLHLGKRVNGFDLLEDQQSMLEHVLDLCEAEHIHAVLLAGDIYDTSQPPAAAVSLFDRFLTELCRRGVQVLAVSGNHDSAERLDYGSRLFSRSGVHIAGRFTGMVRRVTLEDTFGPVDFCLLPFVKSASVAHYLPDAPITDYDSAVAAALATCPPDPARRSVLLAHQFVTASGAAPELSGSETAAVSVGTLDNVDAARFAGYGYTALGHIHRPQRVGCDTVRYAGSPLCYSLDECGASRGGVLVELSAHGATCEFRPLTPRRAMRHLTGPLAELTDPARVCDAEDYIWATLTDPTPQPDAMARLRAAYPNAMKLDYDNAISRAADFAGTAQAVRAKTFDELFAEFFEKMQGRPLSDAERDAVTAMREEAGQ
ncbi:MAG: exonuclease SbcCD subunit D [Gemmiger sp.]